MLDGKIFIPVLQPSFPKVLFHIGIPEKTPDRPYFTIIVPDNGKSTTRATRFAIRETGTYYIYGHADKKTVTPSCEMALLALLQNPKIPIPDSDRRFLTINDVKSSIDEEHSVFELVITGSRFVPVVEEDASIQKIRQINHKSNISGV